MINVEKIPVLTLIATGITFIISASFFTGQKSVHAQQTRTIRELDNLEMPGMNRKITVYCDAPRKTIL